MKEKLRCPVWSQFMHGMEMPHMWSFNEYWATCVYCAKTMKVHEIQEAVEGA